MQFYRLYGKRLNYQALKNPKLWESIAFTREGKIPVGINGNPISPFWTPGEEEGSSVLRNSVITFHRAKPLPSKGERSYTPVTVTCFSHHQRTWCSINAVDSVNPLRTRCIAYLSVPKPTPQEPQCEPSRPMNAPPPLPSLMNIVPQGYRHQHEQREEAMVNSLQQMSCAKMFRYLRRKKRRPQPY